jgi:hypothetical protein
MNIETARLIERHPIKVGQAYPFFCEMQQEYELVEKRMRNYTGQLVTVVRHLSSTEYDGPGPDDDDEGFEVSRAFIVRAKDGSKFQAMVEELNDWDRDLGQYFWPDGTYGPECDATFLVNERK